MNKLNRIFVTIATVFQTFAMAQTSIPNDISNEKQESTITNPVLSPKEQLEVNIEKLKKDPILRAGNWGFVVYDTQKKQKIDEVNKRYKTLLDKKKEEIREIGYALSMHRHFGFDIYLITQSPKKLAAHILADVGCQLHLRRVFKMKRSTIYEFPEAHATVYKSIRDDAINKTIWKFPKHLYGTYTSTEVDTHQSNIPFKYG